jgi:hypothetical protein
MNYITYEDIKNKVENISNKIIGVIVTKDDCPACKNFIETSVSKLKDEQLEIYLLDINNIPTNKILPLPMTPMSYFYIKGSEVFPLLRQGVAKLNALQNEISKFKKILNGEKFNNVF